jgi:hypothetical protein
VEVLEGEERHAVGREVAGEVRTGEDHVSHPRHAAVGDAVADQHQHLAVEAGADVVALAAPPADGAALAPVGPDQPGALGRELGLVARHLQVAEAPALQHRVDHGAEAGRQDEQAVAAVARPGDELAEAVAQPGVAQHQVAHLLRRGPHPRELLLHRLLQRHLARPQARLDRLPQPRVAVPRDDQVERVVPGDRAVEIAGDEQLLHRAGGYQSAPPAPGSIGRCPAPSP